MFKTTIHLKQHTPLIHSKSSVPENGLRASEIKPALDRWLLKTIKNIEEDWFIDKENNKALNYKLRIKCEQHEEFKISTQKKGNQTPKQILGNYFGEGSGFIYKIIQLEIISYFSELIDAIKVYIPGFYMCNNFGNRKTKGFGSFTVSKIDGVDVTFEESKFVEAIAYSNEYFLCWSAIANLTPNNSFIPFFELTLSQYKALKSEDLAKREKSAIQKYFISKRPPVYWEKDFIYLSFSKKNLLSLISKNHFRNTIEKDKLQYAFVRILLGMPNQYEYRILKSRDKVQIGVRDANNKIERFPSPLTYKLINNNIYILVREIHKSIFANEFKFDVLSKSRYEFKTVKFDSIYAPGSGEFDLKEFLEMNLAKHYKLIYSRA
ncbi:MAG: hypothetical protein JNL49_02850 [Bacteroidia bacterium]|nr:hypothetical protein [Bacteroidia bacterium]